MSAPDRGAAPPRAYVVVVSWAGRRRVDVEVVGRTPKRLRIRFLEDCLKGQRGDVRLVHPSVVRFAESTTGGEGKGTR